MDSSRTQKRRGMAVIAATLALLAGLGIAVAPAAAEGGGGGTLPSYDGDQTFPAIAGIADPEDFSWRVDVASRQTLQSVDGQEAEVVYEDGTVAFTITAEKAHDATGTNVPTTLAVSEGDVLTLVVHHREGSYEYPVSAGEGWTVTPGTPTIIVGPPDESMIAAEKRRLEEASPPALIPPPVIAAAPCSVPPVHDLSLKAAKARLRAAHCAIGQVRLAQGVTDGAGKVVKQFRAAGTELAAGAPVAVKLGSR